MFTDPKSNPEFTTYALAGGPPREEGDRGIERVADRDSYRSGRYVFSPAKFEGGVMCGRGLRCKGKIGEAVRPVQSCVRPFSAVLDDRWP